MGIMLMPFWGLKNKYDSILGSMLGAPYLGRLPYCHIPCEEPVCHFDIISDCQPNSSEPAAQAKYAAARRKIHAGRY